MFECGIDITYRSIADAAVKNAENNIITAVQEVGIKIDKEQLLQCINDAKSFYDKGKAEGYDIGYRACAEFFHDEAIEQYEKAGGDYNDIRPI